MANRRALWINAGRTTQLATTDGLLAAELDVTSGNLTLGGTNASAVLLGANLDKDASEALVIGGSNATRVDFGAPIDSDSGALVLGGTNASAVQVGTEIDKDAAEQLVIGQTNATSVRVQNVVLDGQTFDGAASGADLVIGSTNTDTLVFDVGSGQTTKTISIGASNATSVQVDGLLVTGNTIDTAAAGVLTIGGAGSTATSIEIGTATETTTVLGNLQVNGTHTVTQTATFNGDTDIGDDVSDTLSITASVDAPINFAASVTSHFTTTSGDMKLVPEGTTIAQGGLGVALTFTNYTTSSTTLTGTGTAFNTELEVGDAIEVDLDGLGTIDVRRVTAIAGATSLTVNAAFSSDVGPVTHGLNKDDNLFEVYTGNADARVTVDKNGHTTFVRGAVNDPIISLTNEEDSDTAKVYVVDNDPPVVNNAANGDIAMNTVLGKFYWYDGSWNEAGTSTPTSLQGAYNQQSGTPVQLLNTTGDWIVEIDETGTVADWIVRSEDGTANYIATNATATTIDLGSSGVAVSSIGPVTSITSALTVIGDAHADAVTVNAGTSTYNTAGGAKTLTGNGTNTLTVAGTTGGLNLSTTSGALNVSTTSGDIDIATGGAGTLFVQNASNEGLQVDDTGEITLLGGGATLSMTDGSGASGIVMDGSGGTQIDNSGVTGQEIGLAAGGDVDIDAGLNDTTNGGDITLDAVKGSGGGGIISLDAQGASNFTVAAAALTLSTTTSGNIDITAADDINMAAAGSDIDMDAATLTVDMTGAISLDGVGASNWTTDSGDVTMSTTTSGDVQIYSIDRLELKGNNASAPLGGSYLVTDSEDLTIKTNTSGTLSVNAVAALDMDGTTVTLDGSNGVSIDGSGAASNFSSTSQNLTISTITSGTLAVTSVAALDMDGTVVTLDGSTSIGIGTASDVPIDVDASSFTLDASSGFSIDGTGASNVTAASGALTIATTTSGALNLTAADDMNLLATGSDIDMDAATLTVDMTAGISLDAGAASNFTTSAGAITIDAAGSTVLVDSASGTTIDADAGGVTLQATAGNISLTSPAASDVVLTATDNASSDISFQAHGSAVIEFNGATTGDAGDKDLASTFTATNIIGALNELKADSGEFTLSRVAGVGGVTAGNAVYIDADDVGAANRVVKAGPGTVAEATVIGFARTTEPAADAVLVDTQGEVVVSSDLSLDAQGEYVYLVASGEVSTTAPGSGTVLRVGVITDVGTGAGDGKILIQVGTPVTL
jgi:uncharacterized protein (DUF2345 family)